MKKLISILLLTAMLMPCCISCADRRQADSKITNQTTTSDSVANISDETPTTTDVATSSITEEVKHYDIIPAPVVSKLTYVDDIAFYTGSIYSDPYQYLKCGWYDVQQTIALITPLEISHHRVRFVIDKVYASTFNYDVDLSGELTAELCAEWHELDDGSYEVREENWTGLPILSTGGKYLVVFYSEYNDGNFRISAISGQLVPELIKFSREDTAVYLEQLRPNENEDHLDEDAICLYLIFAACDLLEYLPPIDEYFNGKVGSIEEIYKYIEEWEIKSELFDELFERLFE